MTQKLFLHTSEVVARREGGEKSHWVQKLAPLFTGEPQQVYFSLPPPHLDDYDFLKKEIQTAKSTNSSRAGGGSRAVRGCGGRGLRKDLIPQEGMNSTHKSVSLASPSRAPGQNEPMSQLTQIHWKPKPGWQDSFCTITYPSECQKRKSLEPF